MVLLHVTSSHVLCSWFQLSSVTCSRGWYVTKLQIKAKKPIQNTAPLASLLLPMLQNTFILMWCYFPNSVMPWHQGVKENRCLQ